MGCFSPIWVENVKDFERVPVPCGKCVDCKRRRVDSWVFRLSEEDRVSRSSHFLTLTYNTLAVPISGNGFMTLDKSDFQRFVKRLRKNTGIDDIRYYAVGEYGELNSRPHYHAIIFNVETAASYADAWSLRKSGRNGFLSRYNKGLALGDYKDPHPELVPNDKIELGTIDVGTVSGDSIAYTCKYMDKKKIIPLHDRDDRQKEFSLMSKHLGRSYITPQTVRYHKQHLDQLYLTKRGGSKIAMPKYYRDLIFDEVEKERQLHLVHDAIEEQYATELALCEKKGISIGKHRADLQRAKISRFNKRNSKNRNL